jgi:hypothetical protein
MDIAVINPLLKEINQNKKEFKEISFMKFKEKRNTNTCKTLKTYNADL